MPLIESEHRGHLPDRRRVPRGGRRGDDRRGSYPPVLVAESYEGIRQTCSRYLGRFHFQVVEAADGEEALAQITAEPPRVILAELHLPTMPAWRLAHWLTQNWRTRQIPVIVLAGGLGPETDPEFRDLVAGVLVKPFSLQTMLAEVRRVLRGADPH